VRRSVVGAIHQLYIDAAPDHRATTILAGSGRGGTTWIAELMNHDNGYRFMFEPFFARHVPEVRAFKNRQYIRPGDGDPRFLEPARLVVTGRLRNAWTDYYNRRLVAKRRLIKDIRANLFLKWLDVHFPGMPIVLLLRHPLAVASSRVHHAWHDELDHFLTQTPLVEDFLAPHREFIASVRDPFERHVTQWCIENIVPLRQFRRGEIHLAFYEQFSSDPRGELGRLFAFLRKPLPESIFERIERPSKMTWLRPGLERPAPSEIDGWRRYVSKETAGRSLAILERFGLSDVYSEDSLPDSQAAEALLAAN